MAVVYDGSRPATNALTRHAHFYLDGIQRGDGVSNATLNVSVSANTNRLTMGNSTVSRGVDNLMVGKLDDVRILRGFAPNAVGDGKTNQVIRCYMNNNDDFEPPSIAFCPANLIVNTDPSHCYASGVVLGTPAATDNCALASVTSDAPANFALGLNTVIWTATDSNGNKATCQQTVTVIDSEPPTILPPPTGTVDTDSGNCYASNLALGTPSTSDNCAVASVTNNAPATFPLGTNTVTWTVSDGAGYSSTGQQLVVVVDQEPPTLGCPSTVTVAADADQCFASNVNLDQPTASDACGAVIVTNNAPAQMPVGTNVVTWTATDAAVNSNTCQQTVIVTDTQPLTISCPADLTVSAQPGQRFVTEVDLGTPTTSDNCALADISNDAPASFSQGTTVVTWMVADADGNSSTCQQTVIVSSPGTGCPGDTTNSSVVAEYLFREGSGTNAVNTGTDGVSGNARLINGAIFSTDVPPPSAGCGYSISFPASGTGTNTPAVETGPSYDPVANADKFVLMAWVKRESVSSTNNMEARIVTDTSATQPENSAAGLKFRFSGQAGTLALRINGKEVSTSVGGIPPNEGKWHHVAVVVDTTRPATNNLTQNVHFYVDGIQRGDGNKLSNVQVGGNSTRLTIGNSSVTRASDRILVGKIDDVRILRGYAPNAVGNAKTNLVIRCYMNSGGDSEPPSISCPGSVTVNADAGSCAAADVSLGQPLVSDNCLNSSVTNDAPASFAAGLTVVTWTATDGAGNPGTCEQMVTVIDNQPPAISCPVDITVSTDAGGCSASDVGLGQPAASDNCAIAGIANDAPTTFPVGTTTVTWAATDTAGLTATCHQQVTVLDSGLPSIVCPANLTVTTDSGQCSASGVALGAPTTSDNCGVASVVNDAPATFPLGTTLVTWTVSDAAGNTHSCQQTVTVIDSEPPTITCPPDVTTNADPGSSFASGVELGNPTVSDNCSVANVNNDAPAQFPVGTSTVTWTAIDDAGIASSCQQLVTVVAGPAVDTDGDFWTDDAEIAAGTDPNDPDDHPRYNFFISGGGAVVTNAQVRVELAPGLVADFVIIAEDIGFANAITNTFVSAFDYSLLDTSDGMHTLYVKLLRADGTASPTFQSSVELDTIGPSISISSPTNGAVTGQRRINIEGLAADASTNAPYADASRWLQVTVNGDFVNARDTNGLWSAGPEDLVPGTNTFVAVATDRTGLRSTDSVFVIYDPTLATNMPVFTVDVPDTVIVGSTTESFALTGAIDDENASVVIDVLDAVDNTITNASISAAVQGTNWWATIPVVRGTSLVTVTGQNSGALLNSQSFTMIQDTNVFLEITSPLPDATVNAPSVIVTGIASLNLSNATITINGQPATTTVGPDSIAFSSAEPVSLDAERTIISVQVAEDYSAQGAARNGGSGGQPPLTTEETVYRYEPTEVHLREIYESQNSYGLMCHDKTDFTADWEGAPDGAYHARWFVYYDTCGSPTTQTHDGTIKFLCGLPEGHVCFNLSDNVWDIRWPTVGDHAATFYDSRQFFAEDYRDELTVVKHAPMNEEQTVVFRFDGLSYASWFQNESDFEPSTIFFRGSPGFWDIDENGQTNGVAFVVKIQTNTPITIRGDDFQFPSLRKSWFTGNGYTHAIYFDGIGNDKLKVELSSDKAAKSPKEFGFGKTDPVNPCGPESKRPPETEALVVYFSAAFDYQQKQVQPFNVTLRVSPGDKDTVQWTKHSGPNSGALNDASQSVATFSNPSVGGLYQFDLDYLGKETRTQLLLPLAGPEIRSWVESEIEYLQNWAANYKDNSGVLRKMPLLGKALRALDLLGFGNTLDWVNHFTSTSGPCWPGGAETSFNPRHTIYGIAVDRFHLSNFLTAYLGRAMTAWSEESLKKAFNDAATPDDQYDIASYYIGFDVFNGSTLEQAMQAHGYGQQKPTGFGWDVKLWPNTETPTGGGITRPAVLN